MTIAELLKAYRSGAAKPADVIEKVLKRIHTDGLLPIWISLADADEAISRASTVDLSLPLAGVPFAAKDNIDVASMQTTAGCPSFAYSPSRSATVVERLMEAGAILIGKTNMDQFATGLVGTRSPYGACPNAFDARYISGGSSSGSAIAVAKNFCAFSLGTDTAGSGRIPAAFNNLVGMKPTRGVLSSSGVVPACRTLDCVSIFAHTAQDAHAVWTVAQGFDARDPYSRPFAPGAGAAPWINGPFRFGFPPASDLQFFGDTDAPQLFTRAAERLEAIGGVRTTIDFTPFREAAALLYSGPWVAERLAAVGEHLRGRPRDANAIVAEIILSAEKYKAEEAYKAAYRLEELKRAAADEWSRMDILLLPTAGTIYTIEAVNENPVKLNSNLGYYTNFVNLLDLAAISLPAGFRTDGLPFGITLIGPAFCDEALLALGKQYLGEPAERPAAFGCIPIAVVGAHLEGQPLNFQLTQRNARLAKRCRTSPDYRLFALESMPPKPGLLHQPGYEGPGIEVELWNVPENEFGGFVAAVPEPLAIGNVRLSTGDWVKGFVCEPVALLSAKEITHHGGWRSYLARNCGEPEAAADNAVARI